MRVIRPALITKRLPSVLYKLNPDEEVILQPGMFIKIGLLTFLCERFNTGIVSKRGLRSRMEDSCTIEHDIGLDIALKASVYAVIDGHGGEWCAQFLQKELVLYFIKDLKEEL